MKFENIIALIMAEIERAERLHPAWPGDVVKAAAIVAEEAGETLQAANDYDESRSGKSQIATEAVHTAATAIRLLKNINLEGNGNE